MKKIPDVLKKVLNVAFNIGISILGCALWAHYFESISQKVFTSISSVINIWFTDFINQTYVQISYGPNESNILLIAGLILGCYMAFIFILDLAPYVKKYIHKKYNNFIVSHEPSLPDKVTLLDEVILQNKATLNRIKKNNTLLNKVMFITHIIWFLFILYFVGNRSFIASCQNKTLCNIEIVSPYITDHDYKTLKSSFHSISSKDDYDNLQAILDSIAAENNLTLKY